MFRPRVLLLAVALSAMTSACGPTSPTPLGVGTQRRGSVAGEWSGTTAQGRPIAFTVSADERVTSITVGYRFNSCSGTQTFPNLSLETAPTVECIPSPCPIAVTSFRSFDHQAGSFQGASTSVYGLFTGTTLAQGSVDFRNMPDCGSALNVGWTATRR